MRKWHTVNLILLICIGCIFILYSIYWYLEDEEIVIVSSENTQIYPSVQRNASDTQRNTHPTESLVEASQKDHKSNKDYLTETQIACKETQDPHSEECLLYRHVSLLIENEKLGNKIPSKNPFVYTNSTCHSPLKVYVYPIPRKYTLDILMEAYSKNEKGHVFCRNDCPASQFSLEVDAHHFFLTACFRTFDPQEADIFHVPNYSTLGFRLYGKPSLQEGRRRGLMDALALDMALNPFDETAIKNWKAFTKTPVKWWQRHKAKDHLLVSAHPPINQFPWTQYHSFHKYKNVFWLTLEQPRRDAFEPSVQNRVITLPYPSVNAPWIPIQDTSPLERRKYLTFGRFGIHGSVGVRSRLLTLNRVRLFSSKSTLTASQVPHLVNKESLVVKLQDKLPDTWQNIMFQSTFCLCPSGDTPSTRRFFHAVLAGCIPIVISDNLVLPWENTGELSYSWVIKLSKSTLSQSKRKMVDIIKEAVQSINVEEYRKNMLQERGRFVYEMGKNWKKGVWGLVMQQLNTRIKSIK